MQHDDLVRIAHMVDAGTNAAQWTAGKTWEQFESDKLLQAAVAYEVQIIGEAAYHLTKTFCDALPSVPWERITGMRHKLVHDYFRIDPKILWDVVRSHLPALMVELGKLPRP